MKKDKNVNQKILTNKTMLKTKDKTNSSSSASKVLTKADKEEIIELLIRDNLRKLFEDEPRPAIKDGEVKRLAVEIADLS